MKRVQSFALLVACLLFAGAHADFDVSEHNQNNNHSQHQCKARPTRYDDCHPCGRRVHPSNVIEVDYLIVGGGPAGLSTAADLSQALADIGSSDTVALIEKEDYFGGRYLGVDLVEPAGYGGPALKAGLGALRTNPSTFPELRRQMTENEIEVYCTIFNNRLDARGRSKVCGLQNECNIFGNFCSGAEIFVNDTQTGELPIGAAFIGLTGIDDPEGSALNYLLGYESINPATGEECDNGSGDIKEQCPDQACQAYADWKSFLQDHLGLEYAELINYGNVGFLGDQGDAFNACRYIDWYLREFDTLSINCYPEGGMSSLSDKLHERAECNGVDFYLEQPALCIDRSGIRLSHPNRHVYTVRTPDYTFEVKKFLFVSTSSEEIIENLEGDVAEDLKATDETKAPKGTAVATVLLQWDPEEPAWFYDVVNKTGGNFSFRAYGDLDCFARMEIIDTPYHRQHNALRVVYSDFRCQDLWKELIEDAEASGNTDLLEARALRSVRNGHPTHTIPEPIFVKGHYWPLGWYFTEPLSTVTIDELAAYAVDPIDGECDNLCLIGEAWAALYYGWSESAFVSSRNCLEDRFDGALGDALDDIFTARSAIVDDYFVTDPNFSAYPGETTGGQAFPILDNEHFAPFGCLYDTDGSLLSEFASGDDCGEPACDSQGVPS